MCQESPDRAPIERLLQPPSLTARYTSVAITVGIISAWSKLAFTDYDVSPPVQDIHHWKYPLGMTILYLASLPMLQAMTMRFLHNVDVKLLLYEAMVLYNTAQVLLNAWMVWQFLHAVLYQGHPLIAGPMRQVPDTGAVYGAWVHYMNKYLEYLDTYFMILRGRMDQVGYGVFFLHVYNSRFSF